MHPLVKLAKETVEHYVKGEGFHPPEELTSEMQQRAGIFVTIRKGGELRGCIGTIKPAMPNIAEEIIANAISASNRDPRFPPVQSQELPKLTYSVDILTKPEPVISIENLDPKRYGIIIESGKRRGLLLPDIEGINTVGLQIRVCRQKAGISLNESIKLYRFQVKRCG